ncbi:MAG: methyltransferase domain-containing protein [Deltaproteobacteria bacterium]|nr:MAG: methyltransferase domain-containing protein [Deltaproteobacteria bacterium]
MGFGCGLCGLSLSSSPIASSSSPLCGRAICYAARMLHSGALFDAVALPYDLLTRHPVWERHCALMAGRLPRGAKRVLDLGCGPGNSTVHLRRAVGSGALGGDYAMSMLRRARRRALPVVCLDAGTLPVRDASLDAVTMHSVLYLLRDQPGALAEVRRVLRPGGRALLLEPQAGHLNTARGLARALRTPLWAGVALLWRTMSALYGRFTPERLRAALESAGLRVLTIDETLGGLGLLAVAER